MNISKMQLMGDVLMIEYEKKIILDAEEYKYLISLIPNRDTIIQENFYYDTDDFDMNALGVSCRVRKINNKYVATIKRHCFGCKNCSKETSMPVKDEQDDKLFNGLDVKFVGSLTTERTLLIRNEKIKVVLDKNFYLGIVDYEMEIEYMESHENVADKL